MMSYDVQDGYTALHRASMDGCKEIVALLLSNSNIDINLKNSVSDTV